MKKISALIAVVVILQSGVVSAQTPSSSNYQVPESSFSSGSEFDTNSANFSAQGTVGILAVGDGRSTNYDARPGFITPSEEFLELVVQTADVDLGVLDTLTTGTGTAAFYVRSYINGSYVVQTAAPSLTSESNQEIAPLTAAAASVVGSEQFGINLVANTSPVSQGVDPLPDPSTQFANGVAAPGYATADAYQYNQGDIIARAGSGLAWGRTNFTVSYIANVSAITPAGRYATDHDLILIPTY